MPTYDFINTETGEVTEHRMSMTKLDEFKEEHPELERYFGNQVPLLLMANLNPLMDLRK